MKRTMLVGLWAAAFALASTQMVWAQPGGQGGQRGQRGQRGQAFDPTARVKTALGTLGLSEDQKSKTDAAVAKFEEAQKADQAANQTQMTELFQQMRDARTANDDAKMTELRDKFTKLREGQQAKMTSLRDELKAVLTPEQNTKLDAALAQRGGPGGGRTLSLVEGAIRFKDQIKLTDAQSTKMDDLRKAFNDAVTKIRADSTDRAAQATSIRELQTKQDGDAKEVLTADQLTELQKLIQAANQAGPGGDRVGTVLATLNLTEDQQKSIKDIRDAFNEAVRTANRQDRGNLYRKLNDDIGAVLTEEQKTKFTAAMQQGRGQRGQGGQQGAAGQRRGGRNRGGNTGGNPGGGTTGTTPAPSGGTVVIN